MIVCAGDRVFGVSSTTGYNAPKNEGADRHSDQQAAAIMSSGMTAQYLLASMRPCGLR